MPARCLSSHAYRYVSLAYARSEVHLMAYSSWTVPLALLRRVVAALVFSSLRLRSRFLWAAIVTVIVIDHVVFRLNSC